MPGTLIPLLLILWVGAVAVFVWVDLADKFLWVPVLLALAGVFSSILPLATTPSVALIANVATLILFIVSLEVLTRKRRLSVAFDKVAPSTNSATKVHQTDARFSSSRKDGMHYRSVSLILLFLILVALRQPASAQQWDASPLTPSAPLCAEEVVQNLVRMNLERAQALRAYQGTRIYRAEYHGFPGTRSAEMVVGVKYQSPATKEFTVQSATGSKLIIDKVFKKLLQSEKEALGPEMQRRTALNSENYDFTLIGYESTPSGSMYVLSVQPRTKDKFLYRGQIWVDAEDFAVVRIKAEPAKNPSFWTRNTEIEHVYVKVSDFWLPAHNHSVSKIRLGGRADFTIEYKDYQITGASSASNLPTLGPFPSAEASRAQR